MDLNAPETRQEDLAARLQRGEHLVAGELAREFGVSLDTIRRDIIALEQEGLARRVRGGAVARGALPDPLAARLQRPARFRLQLIDLALDALDGVHTLLLDGGATTLAVAERLQLPPGGRVVTPSPYVAVACQRNGIEVFMLGGQLSPSGGVNVGEAAEARLAALNVDLALLGACGIDAIYGLSSDDFAESQLSEAMATAAARVIVLCDASKLGRRALHHTLPPSRIDVLITDATPDQLRPFYHAGYEVKNAQD